MRIYTPVQKSKGGRAEFLIQGKRVGKLSLTKNTFWKLIPTFCITRSHVYVPIALPQRTHVAKKSTYLYHSFFANYGSCHNYKMKIQRKNSYKWNSTSHLWVKWRVYFKGGYNEGIVMTLCDMKSLYRHTKWVCSRTSSFSMGLSSVENLHL